MDGYVDLLAEQGGRCAICGSREPGGKGGWHVDHCHDTGIIRGLLCHYCNVGLGVFRDDPKRLARAIEYLRTYGTMRGAKTGHGDADAL